MRYDEDSPTSEPDIQGDRYLLPCPPQWENQNDTWDTPMADRYNTTSLAVQNSLHEIFDEFHSRVAFELRIINLHKEDI